MKLHLCSDKLSSHVVACDGVSLHQVRHSCEFEWVVTTHKSLCVQGICDTFLESMPKPLQCSLEQEVIRVRKEMGESGNTLELVQALQYVHVLGKVMHI